MIDCKDVDLPSVGTQISRHQRRHRRFDFCIEALLLFRRVAPVSSQDRQHDRFDYLRQFRRIVMRRRAFNIHENTTHRHSRSGGKRNFERSAFTGFLACEQRCIAGDRTLHSAIDRRQRQWCINRVHAKSGLQKIDLAEHANSCSDNAFKSSKPGMREVIRSKADQRHMNQSWVDCSQRSASHTQPVKCAWT